MVALSADSFLFSLGTFYFIIGKSCNLGTGVMFGYYFILVMVKIASEIVEEFESLRIIF